MRRHRTGRLAAVALPMTAVALLIALAVSGTRVQAGPDEADARYVRRGGDWYRVEGGREFRVNPEVISVKFVEGITDYDDFLFRANVGASDLDLLRGVETVRSNRLGIHDLRIPQGADVFDVLDAIRSTRLVEFAEENTFGTYFAPPNDTRFDEQWGLNNVGQTGGTADADVDAPEAWDLNTGFPNVVVAVLDSGTEVTHFDLSDNVWVNPDEIPGNGQDDDNNGRIDDINGWDFFNNNNNVAGPFFHGTHVAGIVAADTNNGTGIAGLAGGFGGVDDGCRMLIGGVGDFFPDGSILDDAILYAVGEGASVITMSLSVGFSAAIANALQSAWDDGVFIDCSAGNGGGPGVAFPATDPNVVAVAATDHNDNRASFSSTGPEVEVAAPGVSILSTQTGGTFGFSDGTSFASPHVAGLAGLLFSAAPGVTNELVRQIINDTADDVEDPGRDDETGHGRINAAAALTAVGAAEPPVIDSLDPGFGAVNQVTSVTITGENFVGNPVVTFGGVPATFVNVIDVNTVLAGAPPGASMDPVDVQVTTPFGSDTAVDGFEYGGTLAAVGMPSIGNEIRYAGNGMPDGDWGVIVDFEEGMKVKKGLNFRIDFGPNFVIIKDSFRTADAPLTGSGQGNARYTIPDDPKLIGEPLFAEGVFDGNGPLPGRELRLAFERVDLIIEP